MSGTEPEQTATPEAAARALDRRPVTTGVPSGGGFGGLGNAQLARVASAAGAPHRRGRGMTPNGAMAAGLRALARRTLMRDAIETGNGTFDATFKKTTEAKLKDGRLRAGGQLDITFTSPTGIKSNKIGFVQFMRFTVNGEVFLFDNEKPRATEGTGAGAGWVVDRAGGKKYGYYGVDDDFVTGTAGRMTFGSRTDANTATDAVMRDMPGIARNPGDTQTCAAKTFAIDIEHGVYLGGVSWGYKVDADGTMTTYDPKETRLDDPQRRAVKAWNAQSKLDDKSKRNSESQAELPVPDSNAGDYNSPPAGGNSGVG